MYTYYLINPYWDDHCCAMIENYIANKLAVLSQFVCMQCFVNRALSKCTNLIFYRDVHNQKETHNKIVFVIGKYTGILRICAASGGGVQFGQFSLNCPNCTPPLSRVYVILVFTQAAEYSSTRVHMYWYYSTALDYNRVLEYSSNRVLEYRHFSILRVQF
jgi:hypothetical protein